jgi:hypothetical protein
MADTRDGILQRQPSGRWAICRPGEDPIEITTEDVFRVEIDGELRPTRMEFRNFTPVRSRAASSWAIPANIIRLTATGFATACAPLSALTERKK